MAGGHDLQEAVARYQRGIELHEVPVEAGQEFHLVGRAGFADIAVPGLAIGFATAAGQHAEEAVPRRAADHRVDVEDQVLG